MLIMLWGDLAAKGVGTGFKDVKAYFKGQRNVSVAIMQRWGECSQVTHGPTTKSLSSSTRSCMDQNHPLLLDEVATAKILRAQVQNSEKLPES